MQLLLVLLAMILGLTVSYNTDGLPFVPAICLFAGLTMVMPTLFNFSFSNFSLVGQNKILIAKNIGVNFVLLPIAAIGIGLLSNDFGIAAGIFLLSVLAGGGMVMHWVKHSNSDTHIGFILLFINLLFLSLSLLMFHLFGVYFAEYYGTVYSRGENIGNFARGALMLLVVIPFVVSRVLLAVAPSIVEFIQKQRVKISNVSIFVIVFYLFSLSTTKLLFEIDMFIILKALIAVILFYAVAFALTKLVFNTQDAKERAASWHVLTRYITLALILSTFSVVNYGVTLIVPIMIAYFIQLPLAVFYSKQLINYHE